MYKLILSVLSCAIFSQDLDIFLCLWFQLSFNFIKSKSNRSWYSLYYAEACNEFARPISASLRLSNAAPFEEISHRRRAVATLYLIWLARDLNLRPPALETGPTPRGYSGAVSPKWLLVLPNENCAPQRGLRPEEINRLGLLECKSRPKTPKLAFTALEFASKNCFFVIFVD